MCDFFIFEENLAMKEAKITNIKPEHQEFLERVGRKVEELRKNKKIKITELVGEIGMHRNAYRQLANGKTYFKISALLKLLDYFELNYYDFLKKIKEEDTHVGAKKPRKASK